MITANDEDWCPIVAVPARDEAERLPDLLQALSDQTWIDRRGCPLPVILVLNNCEDGSAAIARACGEGLPRLDMTVEETVFPMPQAHVGSARRRALQIAFGQLTDVARGVLLTTDADATPHADWVESNLAAVDAGADVVGGQIIGHAHEEACLGDGLLRRVALHMRYAELCDRLAARIDPLAHDPWPRHRDHTGASLAVRADAYLAVGGLPAESFREDLAFVSRLRAANFKLVHPLSVKVGVSARLVGRAPGGMADCLRSWIAEETAGRPHLVEDPDAVLARLVRRRALRLEGGPDAGAFIECWAQDDPDAPATIPVEAAIATLERLVAEQEHLSDAA